MQLPVTVLNTNTKRDTGKKAQLGNIMAAKVGNFRVVFCSVLKANAINRS